MVILQAFVIIVLSCWAYHLLYRLDEVSGFPPKIHNKESKKPAPIKREVEEIKEAKCDLIPQAPPLESPIKRNDDLAVKFNKLFKGKLSGKGQLFVDLGKKYNVNPALAAAISCFESTCGTSKKIIEQNNPCGLYEYKKKRFYSFASIDEGIEQMFSRLSRYYIARGLDTIEEIQPVWCPVGAENDPKGINKHWKDGVKKYYNLAKS